MANKYFDVLRAPHQVAFDITNNCNLRCLHCFNSSGENDVVSNELSDSEVLNFMKNLSEMNLYNVCFCGGETFLRKDLMCECIKVLKPSGTHCTAVTNGVLATSENIHKLESAGLDGIQFSLDGLKESHERLRNKKGVFSSVIEAIDYVLNETMLRLSIAFTPTVFNVNDFPKVYELLVEIFEKSNRHTSNDYIDLRLQPLMLLGRAKDNSSIIPTESQYRWLVQQMDQVSIHANGDIVVSAYLPLVVGNIRKHSLSEYWDAGLKTIWATSIVQYLSARVQSVYDMERVTTLISDINMNGCLYIDLMENDLNDLNLLKDVILKEWE